MQMKRNIAIEERGDIRTILEPQARWDRISTANLYDTLDGMRYPNQCLDLSIKPPFPKRHLARVAVTVRGKAEIRGLLRKSKGEKTIISGY